MSECTDKDATKQSLIGAFRHYNNHCNAIQVAVRYLQTRQTHHNSPLQ